MWSREQVCGECGEPYTSCTPCIHLSRECEGVWEVCWGDVKGTRVGAKGTRVGEKERAAGRCGQRAHLPSRIMSLQSEGCQSSSSESERKPRLSK